MDSTLVFLIVALAAALLAAFGLWSWRRLTRHTDLGAAVPTPAVTLRANTSSRVNDNSQEFSHRESVPVLSDARSSEADIPAGVADNYDGEVAVDMVSHHDDDGNGGENLELAAADDAKPLAHEPICDVGAAATDSVPLPDPADLIPHDASPPPSVPDTTGVHVSGKPETAGVTVLPPEQSASDELPDTGLAAGATEPPAEEGISDDTAPASPQPDGPSTCATADDGAGSSTGVQPFEEALPQPEPAVAPARRPRQPAVHRDRRGQRRTVAAAPAAPEEDTQAVPSPTNRVPAEARLRLSLHPIRRVATLSVVLTRPDGFPQRVTVQADGEHTVDAYDMQRYDDLDLPWTSLLLDGELRLDSAEGFQWLRSARQIHIFAEDPNEPELISVGAARLGAMHSLICRSADEEAVRAAAASAGAPDLQSHVHWQGIPTGWVVLSGYAPTHATSPPLPPSLRPLDPGEGLEIAFEGGLEIRPHVYAWGHPPRIVIRPAPGTAAVTVGGEPAILSDEGAWVAPGWDNPGQHIVDVVPGPSLSYEIAADPWAANDWTFWDAHPERFGANVRSPWARAELCGAQVRGPTGEFVFAAGAQTTLVALGAKWGATPLQRRDEVSVSIGLMGEPPTFLLAASGPRRSQGQVLWLGLAPVPPPSRRIDVEWASVVRTAASRRLALKGADAVGEDAWRKAKERARRLKRQRT